MDNFILNLTKKLNKPILVDIYNAQIESIRDGRNDVFENEDDFLKWFVDNVLYPERRVFLQNLLKQAFEYESFVPSLESEISESSRAIFNNIKTNYSEDIVKDFIKIVNSLYLINNFESEYESPGPKLTIKDIDTIFKDFSDMIKGNIRSDDFKETLEWIDNFVYYQHFEANIKKYKNIYYF